MTADVVSRYQVEHSRSFNPDEVKPVAVAAPTEHDAIQSDPDEAKQVAFALSSPTGIFSLKHKSSIFNQHWF